MQLQAAAAQAKKELLRLKVQVAELRANIRIKDAALEAKDAAVQSKDAVIDAKDYLIRRVQGESQLQPEFAAPPAASALQSAPLPPPHKARHTATRHVLCRWCCLRGRVEGRHEERKRQAYLALW
jgi:hypothetical protein